MKFYVHHEAAKPHFTLAVEWPADSCANAFELSARFAQAFSAAHPKEKPMSPAEVMLIDDDGAPIYPQEIIAHYVSEGCDLFAERGAQAQPGVAAAHMASAASAAASSSSKAGASAASADLVGAQAKEMLKALKPYLQAADTAFKNRSYKKAAEIYGECYMTLERASLMVPGLPKELAVVPRRLGEIEVVNERADSALKWLQRAVRACPTDVESRVLLSDAFWLGEEEDEAVGALRGALEALDQAKRPKKTKSLKIKLGLQLFKAGHRQEGGGLLTKLLGEDQDDPEALNAYGQAALALGQTEDALKIYLRLVVAKSDDTQIKRMLSKTLAKPDGVALLHSHLAPSPATASALAFLASTAKDFSGIPQAISLYQDCCAHQPSNASYALNLMHLHELDFDYAKAVATLAAHCEANPSVSVGTVSLAELAAALPLPDELKKAMWTSPTPQALAAYAAGKAAGQLPDLPKDTGAESPDPATLKPAGTYGETELDVLALAYTVVKVLYIAGALACLPKLIALVEPARKVADLHLTRVRNENAYYCCVAQIATMTPLPMPALPPLYVMGDSHSLAPAWRTVAFRGAPHLLVPRLVTGCKVWHLREDSDFFPKYNFEQACKQVPDGSAVVFIFGEIDCREGLLVAVERMRYPDLEAGIAHTVKIYVSTLKALASSKKLTVLVHPVPPVLNETRHIVSLFNKHLREAVKKERASMHMLDFFDELLTPGGDALKEGLKLDGTHMHPDYVKIMEKELAKVPAP